MSATLEHFIPAVRWLRAYRRADLTGDITAGIITAILLIPQAMAYSVLAGLPPEIGLYASIAPPMLYALFGSSRALAVGPVAVASLMVAAAVGAVAVPGTAEYYAAALILALMIGLILLVLGIARLGFVANFLSHPVMAGFTSAAAIVIAISQLKHLLGLSPPRTESVDGILLYLARHLGDANLAAIAIGGGVRAGTVVRGVVVAPLYMAGFWVGGRLFPIAPRDLYRKVALWLLIATGLAVIAL